MLKARFLIYIIEGFALLLILKNEFLCYLTLPFVWPTKLECIEPFCVKILLVADPQILGNKDSNIAAIWDADKYLERTFYKALQYSSPHLVIFLGDLTDEGHVSSETEFLKYVERFKGIFDVPAGVMCLYVPGDNDIGGEDEPISVAATKRFEENFGASDIVQYGPLQFAQIFKLQGIERSLKPKSGSIRIGLTHLPIFRKYHSFSRGVAEGLAPNLIFSGHDHDSVHISASMKDVWRIEKEKLDPEVQNWTTYKLVEDRIHEIVVPTCSYRMGMESMGYGLAHIDVNSKTIAYTVLWLPERLPHLISYVLLIVFVIFLSLILIVVNLNRRLLRLIKPLYRKCFSRQYLNV